MGGSGRTASRPVRGELDVDPFPLVSADGDRLWLRAREAFDDVRCPIRPSTVLGTSVFSVVEQSVVICDAAGCAQTPISYEALGLSILGLRGVVATGVRLNVPGQSLELAQPSGTV